MWTTIINILLGVWIMFSPELLQFEKSASDNNYIVGPLILTFAIIALWEVNRPVRFLNLAAGVWLTISPFILAFQSPVAIWVTILSGMLLIICSLIRGRIKGNYGGGWHSLFRKEPVHLR